MRKELSCTGVGEPKKYKRRQDYDDIKACLTCTQKECSGRHDCMERRKKRMRKEEQAYE